MTDEQSKVEGDSYLAQEKGFEPTTPEQEYPFGVQPPPATSSPTPEQENISIAGLHEFLSNLREQTLKQIAADVPPMRTWEIDSPTLGDPITVKAHGMLMADDGRVVFMRTDEFGHDYVSEAFRFDQFDITLVEDQS